jgi:hypothetical protein
MQCMQREAPDLRYVDGTRVLNLELTDAYYDEQSDAAMQWDAARKKANAPDSWSGGDFDRALIKNINAGIAKKCRKDYGRNCVLVDYLRVARRPCSRPALSELGVKVSLHPAQALRTPL